MRKKNVLMSEKGFTLIEIIAVLVILGILAAVAIPKYNNLQADAKNKAVQGALAAGGSNASMEFAKEILTGGTTPAMASVSAALNAATSYTTVGDFKVSYSAVGETGITVTLDKTTGPYDLSDVTLTSKTFNLNPS